MRTPIENRSPGDRGIAENIVGEIRHSNVWMVERDSDDLWFRMGAAFKCVNQGQGPRNECYFFSLGSSNDFGSRSEEVHGMPVVCFPPVDSKRDVVHKKLRRESQSVVELHYALLGLMGCVHSRREEFCQRGLCFNGCRDSMSEGTMWLQTIQKLMWRWSRLKLMRRWFWRRRPPEVRWRSNEEMEGHPFKHRRKRNFENVQSISLSSSQ